MPHGEQQPQPEEQHPQPARKYHFTQEEWRQFWEREYTTLLTVARKLMQNDPEAEDAVQEAFTSFYQTAHRGWSLGVGDESLQTAVRKYLIGVVRYKVFDVWRERQRFSVSGPQPAVDSSLQVILHNMRQVAPHLSATSRELLLFCLAHHDVHPDEHWPLFAAEKGFNPASKPARNSHFDQPKSRLRKELRTMGVYAW